jgi:hypothetical protein
MAQVVLPPVVQVRGAEAGLVTTTTANFFDMPTDRDPRREGGRPMLIPKGLESSGVRAAYSRASGLAEHIENQFHIHRWEMRYLAKAMGQHEDLAALAAVETYSTGLSDATWGADKSASGKRLDSIIERALDRVRIHEKADRGTAVHGSTEPGAPRGVERLRPATEAFFEINRREAIQLVGTELFTANDITMSAGTFDHLVKIPGHPLFSNPWGNPLDVVADKKTGRFSPFEWAIQIASYANGDPYNVETDVRHEWPGDVCKDWALVWQIDSDDETVKLWVIDIAFGWEMAQLAAKVRDGHERRDIAAKYKSPTFEQRLHASTTRDDLTALWYAVEDQPDLLRQVEEKARTAL